MTSKRITSPPWNGWRLVHPKDLGLGIALLSTPGPHSIGKVFLWPIVPFPAFWNFRPRLARLYLYSSPQVFIIVVFRHFSHSPFHQGGPPEELPPQPLALRQLPARPSPMTEMIFQHLHHQKLNSWYPSNNNTFFVNPQFDNQRWRCFNKCVHKRIWRKYASFKHATFAWA